MRNSWKKCWRSSWARCSNEFWKRPTGKFLFRVTTAGRDFPAAEGTDQRYGARHLKRAIERNIVYPLANLLATEQVHVGDLVRIDWDGVLKESLVRARKLRALLLDTPPPMQSRAAAMQEARDGKGVETPAEAVAEVRNPPPALPAAGASGGAAPQGRKKTESQLIEKTVQCSNVVSGATRRIQPQSPLFVAVLRQNVQLGYCERLLSICVMDETLSHKVRQFPGLQLRISLSLRLVAANCEYRHKWHSSCSLSLATGEHP